MGNLVQSSQKNFGKIRTAELNGGIAVPDAVYAYFSRRLNKHWASYRCRCLQIFRNGRRHATMDAPG
jgi:hypothetical protein